MKSETEEVIVARRNENEPLIKKDNGLMKDILFYTYAVAATFLFGTKLVCLELAHFTKIWIFFIEHVVI